jgi:hypothetical protein
MAYKQGAMNTIGRLFLVAFFLPLRVLGGEIYGNITDGGKSVGVGVKVELTVGDKSYTAQTDRFGSYRVLVREKGKGVLKVNYLGQSPSLEVYSYDNAVRYNLVLEKKDNKYSV